MCVFLTARVRRQDPIWCPQGRVSDPQLCQLWLCWTFHTFPSGASLCSIQTNTRLIRDKLRPTQLSGMDGSAWMCVCPLLCLSFRPCPPSFLSSRRVPPWAGPAFLFQLCCRCRWLRVSHPGGGGGVGSLSLTHLHPAGFSKVSDSQVLSTIQLSDHGCCRLFSVSAWWRSQKDTACTFLSEKDSEHQRWSSQKLSTLLLKELSLSCPLVWRWLNKWFCFQQNTAAQANTAMMVTVS